ncbi:hypothetical protein [Paraburkholderia ferrariae]|uniref:hypothetical protein n=1 Tax=Paraburkholderia ferrariae TaxID=386056 RepID=UPI0012EB6CD1|nr:hypothetical protein [Paraburkholderia ferrariae]
MPMSDAEPQAVIGPVTVCALFIVATLDPGDGAVSAVRNGCGKVAAFARSAGKRIALATPGNILLPIRAAHISHG